MTKGLVFLSKNIDEKVESSKAEIIFFFFGGGMIKAELNFGLKDRQKLGRGLKAEWGSI